LKPLDLLLRLPPDFMVGVLGDLTGKFVNRNGKTSQNETFASLMEKGLGKTICQDFYFPYARKIWGVGPQELSVTQARRRVKNNSLGKMIQKALSAVPGLKPKGAGRFFYPRKGFGQISQVYYQHASQQGAIFELGARVKAVNVLPGERPSVQFEKDNQLQTIQADHIWSTIPITILARMLNPAPPAELLDAAQKINYRAMILIYLLLDTPQFTEYDAHYFPGSDIAITRLSEPKNYSASQEPVDRTVLCAELPCLADGKEWQMTDEDLGKLVCDALERAGLPAPARVLQVVTRRLRFAYPIYQQGYEQYFDRLDEWVGKQENLLTFGRQGLFAHDNTHHALYMAYCAVRCLTETGEFDGNRWESYRKIFETHVVED
jgi:protoporphyrinogen oxidase